MDQWLISTGTFVLMFLAFALGAWVVHLMVENRVSPALTALLAMVPTACMAFGLNGLLVDVTRFERLQQRKAETSLVREAGFRMPNKRNPTEVGFQGHQAALATSSSSTAAAFEYE